MSTVSTTKKYLGGWEVSPGRPRGQHGQPCPLPCAPLYLTMKSKLEPASMSRPSNVETAPSVTGANVRSRARAARRFRLPWAVRKPWGNKRSGSGSSASSAGCPLRHLPLGHPCPDPQEADGLSAWELSRQRAQVRLGGTVQMCLVRHRALSTTGWQTTARHLFL